MRPLLQVRRSIETNLSLWRPCDRHDPAFRGLVPHDLWIAEISLANVEHRIAGKLRPCAATIIAVGNVLVLQRFFRVMTGIDRDQRRLAVFAEAAAILPVDHSAAGENHHAIFFRERHWKMFPMDEVRADGMSPAHVTPSIAEWVELIEQVVFAVVEDQAVRIVHPVGCRREVELRAEFFSIEFCSATDRDRDNTRQEANGQKMTANAHISCGFGYWYDLEATKDNRKSVGSSGVAPAQEATYPAT